MNRFFQENGLGMLFIVVLGIVFPITYSSQLIDPVFAPRFGELAIANSIIISILLVKNKIFIPQSRVFWGIFIGILLLAISSILINKQITEGVNRLTQILSAFLIFIGMLSMLKAKLIKPKHLLVLLITLGSILTVQTYSQIIQFYFAHHHLPFDHDEIKASMANKSLLSTLLFACLPAFIICYNWLPKIIRPLLLVIIIANVGILMITLSKSSVLALFVFVFIFVGWKIFFYCQEVHKASVLKSILIALLLCITSIVTVGFAMQPRLEPEVRAIKRSYKLIEEKSSYAEERPSTETRLLLYYHTLKLIKQNPIIGVGPGNWKLCFPCSGLHQFGGNIKEGTLIFQRAHSDVLQFIAEFGIPAFLLLCLLLGYFLFYLIRALLSEKSKNHKQSNMILFSFFMGYLVILFFDFSTERPSHLFVLGSYATLTLFFNKDNYQHLSDQPQKKWIGWAGLILSGFMGLSAYHQIKGEYYSAKMIHSNFKQTIAYEKAAHSFAYKLDPFSIPLKWQSGVAYYTNGQYHKALAEFNQAYTDNPCQIHVINNLASTHVQLGNLKEAIRFYLLALKISPNFEESLVNLSAIYFNQGMLEEAFTTISKCSLKATHPNYKLFLRTILHAYAEQIKPGNAMETKELEKVFISSMISNNSFKALLLGK